MSFETLNLISYSNNNQDDQNDGDFCENNEAKVIIAVFILLNFYVLHSKGSWWALKMDVLMFITRLHLLPSTYGNI